ncbi:MAG: electron transport complex subunit RsxC, partial [Clostridia bacterium]|nr:electron transport complex subunit RsxC [Clostridia bacterium]
VEPRPHTSGRMVMAVVIDNDFKDTPVEVHPPKEPLEELESDDILATIRDSGIVGMGGAAFPGNVKALSALGKVDTLIANACECEPYITADDYLLRRTPEQILSGMEILKAIIKPERAVIAIEDNKKEGIKAVRALLKDHPGIEVQVLPTRYPQGSEKQLIQALTKRQVPAGALPASVGCAVFNVATFAAIHRAVRLGYPITQRIVTVSGEAIATPQNFIVRLGTSFHDLIEIAGGLHDKTERVISGGPMMGFAQKDLSVPVIKATNSVLCLLKDVNGAAENPVCLRCGKCVSVCPMKLQPLYMYRYQKAGDVNKLIRYNLMDCMECGSCAFTCPGKLPLVETFRMGKKMIKEASAK